MVEPKRVDSQSNEGPVGCLGDFGNRAAYSLVRPIHRPPFDCDIDNPAASGMKVDVAIGAVKVQRANRGAGPVHKFRNHLLVAPRDLAVVSIEHHDGDHRPDFNARASDGGGSRFGRRKVVPTRVQRWPARWPFEHPDAQGASLPYTGTPPCDLDRITRPKHGAVARGYGQSMLLPRHVISNDPKHVMDAGVEMVLGEQSCPANSAGVGHGDRNEPYQRHGAAEAVASGSVARVPKRLVLECGISEPAL